MRFCAVRQRQVPERNYSNRREGSETPDPLITEVQPWAQSFGDGVDETPYGLPIKFEDDVIRRNVEWLTADTDQFHQLHADPCAGWYDHAAGLRVRASPLRRD